jgi:hypothetical protein
MFSKKTVWWQVLQEKTFIVRGRWAGRGPGTTRAWS